MKRWRPAGEPRRPHNGLGRGGPTAHKGETAQSLIERTDACLYAAKRHGRNRVMCETDPEVARPTRTGGLNGYLRPRFFSRSRYPPPCQSPPPARVAPALLNSLLGLLSPAAGDDDPPPVSAPDRRPA